MRHHGNGHGKGVIRYVETPGHVHILPDSLVNLPADIAVIVHNAMMDWLQRHPDVRVRAVLPITQDGQTVMIHLWYDDANP